MVVRRRPVHHIRCHRRSGHDQLYEEAKLLPPPLAREALDFVLFPRGRQDQGEWRDLMAAQASALANTWDHNEDEAWNNV